MPLFSKSIAHGCSEVDVAMLSFMIGLVGSFPGDVLLALVVLGLLAWAAHSAANVLRDHRARRRQVRNRQRLRTEFWGYE